MTSQINQNHELLNPHSRELNEDLVESKVQEIEIKGQDETARWREEEEKAGDGEGGRSRPGRSHLPPAGGGSGQH